MTGTKKVAAGEERLGENYGWQTFASESFGGMKKARYRVLTNEGEEAGVFQLWCLRKRFIYYS